jgi:hypothetical protein
MKKLFCLTFVAASLASLAGCASTYSNIEKTGDNTYLITRTKQGFFKTDGSLFQCTAAGETKLNCKEVGTP